MIFRNQNIVNANFEQWFVYSDGSRPHFWHYSDFEKKFDDDVRRSTTSYRDNFSINFFNSAESGTIYTDWIYSPVFEIQNSIDEIYTWSAWVRNNEGVSNGRLWIEIVEYTNKMTLRIISTLLDNETVLADWIQFTRTIGGIGSGAATELDADTIFIRVRMRARLLTTFQYHVDDMRFGGNTEFIFRPGAIIPKPEGWSRSQLKVETLGGSYRVRDWGNESRVFPITFRGLTTTDYLSLVAFLESPDIQRCHNTFIFNDGTTDWDVRLDPEEEIIIMEPVANIHDVSLTLYQEGYQQ